MSAHGRIDEPPRTSTMRALAFLAEASRANGVPNGNGEIVSAVRASGTKAMVAWATRPVRSPGALATSPMVCAVRSQAEARVQAETLARTAVPGRFETLLGRRWARRRARSRSDLRAGPALSEHRRILGRLTPQIDELAARAESVRCSAMMSREAIEETQETLDTVVVAVRAGGIFDPDLRGSIIEAALLRRSDLQRFHASLVEVEAQAGSLSHRARQASRCARGSAFVIGTVWGRLLRETASTPDGGSRPIAASLASALAFAPPSVDDLVVATVTTDEQAERLAVITTLEL